MVMAMVIMQGHMVIIMVAVTVTIALTAGMGIRTVTEGRLCFNYEYMPGYMPGIFVLINGYY